MVRLRFSHAAIPSLLPFAGSAASIVGAASGAGRTVRGFDPPPLGARSVSISPTSSILLGRIRDALLDHAEDVGSESSRRGGGVRGGRDGGRDGGGRRRALLLDRALSSAFLHPLSPLDPTSLPPLVADLPPGHAARRLVEEHNSNVEMHEARRHLSRFEAALRRRLGLFPFGDLDAGGALDGNLVGYGPMGQPFGDGGGGGTRRLPEEAAEAEEAQAEEAQARGESAGLDMYLGVGPVALNQTQTERADAQGIVPNRTRAAPGPGREAEARGNAPGEPGVQGEPGSRTNAAGAPGIVRPPPGLEVIPPAPESAGGQPGLRAPGALGEEGTASNRTQAPPAPGQETEAEGIASNRTRAAPGAPEPDAEPGSVAPGEPGVQGEPGSRTNATGAPGIVRPPPGLEAIPPAPESAEAEGIVSNRTRAAPPDPTEPGVAESGEPGRPTEAEELHRPEAEGGAPAAAGEPGAVPEGRVRPLAPGEPGPTTTEGGQVEAAEPVPPGEPTRPAQQVQQQQQQQQQPQDEEPSAAVVPPDAPIDARLPPGVSSGEILAGGRLDSYQTVPLLQGYGTHYATVWVGSPEPQRVSVIVDTGSHFTAFPCKNCKGCGEEHHTDNYFDPESSETFRKLGCDECSAGARCSRDGGLSKGAGGEKTCNFGQSYTEGSSWRAYEARDRFFCGGPDPSDASDPIDNSYAIDFMFGCQTSETGLFVGQLADGIMGMAAHTATLVHNMHALRKLEHKMFAMCFRRELEASRRGVTAGVLTLGGVDGRLQRTPMVYARNTVKDGWFTVYVKGVFLRPGGGQSAAAGGGGASGAAFGDAHAESGLGPGSVPGSGEAGGVGDPVRVTMNPGVINAGKGVIVDSGTTDTYFHRALGVTFNRAWKAIVGRDHNNKAVQLTRDELMSLPTLLIQIEAYDDGSLDGGTAAAAADEDELWAESEPVPGLAGSLDPSSPNDVLLAVPATHYMEYSPKDDAYTSRLYFTESAGGVLGANAMMGHDVLFDWENGRVGFAESGCEYREVEGGGIEDEGEEAGNDCRLGVPSLSEGCLDTVDVTPCEDGKNDELVLRGTEKWTMVVESPGTPSGMSCEEVLLRDVLPGEDPPTVSCDGKGLCASVRPCEMLCQNALTAGAAGGIEPVPVEIEGSSSSSSAGEVGEEDAPPGGPPCGENLWGACEYSCRQTRIESTLMSDGKCHETSRETRPCHIDACGRSDPCRVPFVVHAILGFRGANAPLFTGEHEERFAEAFAKTVNMNRVGRDELFGPGDVKVLMANHWYGNDGDKDGVAPIGMKLIVEISIFNPNATLPDVVYEPVVEESPEDVDVEGGGGGGGAAADDSADSTNSTAGEENDDDEEEGAPGGVRGKAKQTLDAMIAAVRGAWDDLGGPPMATCEESDTYPLARTALHVHMELERATFMRELILVLMESSEEGGPESLGGGGGGGGGGAERSSSFSDPFSPLYKTRSYRDESEFLSSWTIKTEIGGGTYHDHKAGFPGRGGFDGETFVHYLRDNGQVVAVALAALLCVCCAGCCCGRSCARRRYERHAAALMEKLAARTDERRRGRYAKVGTGRGAADDGDENEDEDVGDGRFGAATYRDDPVGEDGGLGKGVDEEVAGEVNGGDENSGK